jgi:hypothetical protein
MAWKRMFAAPFVLTSALAACGGSQPAAEEPVANPPPPAQEAPPAQGPTDPPASEALPDAPTGEGGKVEKRDDGTCWYIYPQPVCPPKTLCNPPPPKQVKCSE